MQGGKLARLALHLKWLCILGLEAQGRECSAGWKACPAGVAFEGVVGGGGGRRWRRVGGPGGGGML